MVPESSGTQPPMLCQHSPVLQLFGACANMHRWAVTFSAFGGFFFFFTWNEHNFLKQNILVQYHVTWEHLEPEIYRKHCRDKKYDEDTQCYILLFILWAGVSLIKGKLEFISTKPILSKIFPRNLSNGKE